MYIKATARSGDKSGVDIPGHGISTKRRGRKSCQQIHSVKERFFNKRDYYSIPIILNKYSTLLSPSCPNAEQDALQLTTRKVVRFKSRLADLG